MSRGLFIYTPAELRYDTQMKILGQRRVKIAWVIVGLLVLAGGAYGAQRWQARGEQSVQAAKVALAGRFETSVSPSSLVPGNSSGTHASHTQRDGMVMPPDALAVPILMYHHVGSLPPDADALRRDLTVSAQDFETEVAWLSQRGYSSVSLAEVYQKTQGTGSLPVQPVVFTFDDGYADVFQVAVPILLKYHMRGSFAVVPGFLGQPDYATWDMVEAAHKAGMEIVSHTENHFDGSSTKFDAQYIRQNLEQSLRELETRLGSVPRILVYPYGHYTQEYIKVAQQVGFVMALTTHYGRHVDVHNLMLTPRVRVHGFETMEKFEESITGIKR